MDRYRELLHAWKNADNAAKLADRLLTEKFDAYPANKGALLPSEDERPRVQRLRAEANESLRPLWRTWGIGVEQYSYRRRYVQIHSVVLW